MMHNAMNLQPPRSPISPSPLEVEIPSVGARMQGYMDAGYFEEYGHIFYPDVGATSSTPAPGQGVFGPYTFYGAGGPSGSAPSPPPPDYGFGTLGAPGTPTMATPHDTQTEASCPSAVEIFAQSAAASIFGTHPGMHDWGDRTPSDATGNVGNGQ
jgi:hypothetical protein